MGTVGSVLPLTAPSVAGAAADLLRDRRIAVLTGAGVSTDSGIPDYRGPTSVPRTPMTYQEFLTPKGRQRYWARSFIGWQRMRTAAPNPGHSAIAALQGQLAGIVTQNVDRLHQRAGSTGVVDLHGRIDRVVCLTCGQRADRAGYQRDLAARNPDFELTAQVEIAPDGDAMLERTDTFAVADCDGCGGIVKPDVVFFGESVRPDVVARATALIAEAEALLVAGSSLTVYSGRRFVKQAAQRGIPIVLINRGPTKGDELVDVKWDCGTSEGLTELVDRLGA
jgi:NAD-dependent SIR2 family protein deacetylase